GLRRLLDFYAVGQQLVDQDGGRGRVALLLGNHVGVRRFLAEALHVVAGGLIAVVQQRLAVLRGGIEDRHGGAQHVAHRVAQPPPAALPGAGIEDLAAQPRQVGEKRCGGKGGGGGEEEGRVLGKERNRIAEDVGEIEEAGIPVVEA